jgi:hypothetical protein
MASRAAAIQTKTVQPKPQKSIPNKLTKESGQLPVEDGMDTDQITALAYECWQRRGCPIGSPEVDWFQAEQELKRRTIETAA